MDEDPDSSMHCWRKGKPVPPWDLCLPRPVFPLSHLSLTLLQCHQLVSLLLESVAHLIAVVAIVALEIEKSSLPAPGLA